jgi:hypothetical protein
MIRAVHDRFIPDRIILLADDGAGQDFLVRHLEFIQDMKMKDGEATAFVCQDHACQLPTSEIPAMIKLITGRLESSESASKVGTDAAAAIPPGE